MSQEFHNPYEASNKAGAPAPPVDDGVGLLRQLTPLGWCLIVQGVLKLIVGGLLIAIAGLVAFELNQIPDPVARDAGIQPGDETFLVFVYGALGCLTILASLFRMFAAVRLMRYQSRMMCFVSLGVGALTTFNGCCSITSIGLLVWGVIVLLNEPVARAFELRATGHSKERIDSMLGLR